MTGFLGVEKIILPKTNAEKAYSFMKKAGQEGVEGVCLFVGRLNGNVFEITDTIIPEQTAMKIKAGLLYSVDGDELHRINVWLSENNLRLIGQIHSHPNRAYHSETDDAYPIVATLGGISIVVPDFAMRAMDIDDWAIYRLYEKDGWIELTSNEVENLFQLV